MPFVRVYSRESKKGKGKREREEEKENKIDSQRSTPYRESPQEQGGVERERTSRVSRDHV
ncbi:hypothetical protein M413DRAFT_444716 [Hebeloma cylindrosporum]|uniref:Uncharacterized protein n=1 Tax=Hebeloma cylindrosporum TaxID=76867 RepID=A0A0C3C086_HEBCY|nr:hypothetical protein M413DRAFT_444716 [Hebeloma cylindrosporum h7]